MITNQQRQEVLEKVEDFLANADPTWQLHFSFLKELTVTHKVKKTITIFITNSICVPNPHLSNESTNQKSPPNND